MISRGSTTTSTRSLTNWTARSSRLQGGRQYVDQPCCRAHPNATIPGWAPDRPGGHPPQAKQQVQLLEFALEPLADFIAETVVAPLLNCDPRRFAALGWPTVLQDWQATSAPGLAGHICAGTGCAGADGMPTSASGLRAQRYDTDLRRPPLLRTAQASSVTCNMEYINRRRARWTRHADTDATHVSGALRACTGTAACIRQHAAWRASDNMQRASDYIRQPCIRQHAAPQNVGARSAGLACTHALASRSASKCPVPEVELVRHPAGPSRSLDRGRPSSPVAAGRAYRAALRLGSRRCGGWKAAAASRVGCLRHRVARCRLARCSHCCGLHVAPCMSRVALRSHVLQVCTPRAE
jgi:hypothetical protein